jgi:cytosine deaminase
MAGLRGVRLASGESVDVVIRDDLVAAVGPGVAQDIADAEDGGGKLLLPGYLDTHVHLDKVLTRGELAEHDGSLAGAIAAIHIRKRAYTVEDVRARARAAIESSVLAGTTRLRSHVDVDTIGGLLPLQGVLAAAQDCEDIAEVQVVAFPQEGILRDPGTSDLMAQAMREGAHVVGGMPHWEHGEADQREHVRLCFELADRFGRDLDMHVDETDDGAIRTLEMVADEALQRGWQGRVTAGHVCSLAAADDDYAARVIEKCARSEMTVVTNPHISLMIQGRGDHGLIRRGTTRVAELRAAGVNLAFGQDCVRDGFYPFGRGDLLEVALIACHSAHLSTRADMAFALRALTEAPAKAWKLDDYGIRAGARADLQLLAAPSWEEALRLQRPPERVWFRGREVARSSFSQQLRTAPVDARR